MCLYVLAGAAPHAATEVRAAPAPSGCADTPRAYASTTAIYDSGGNPYAAAAPTASVTPTTTAPTAVVVLGLLHERL